MSKTVASPSVSTMVANILRYYGMADETQRFEGLHWYDSARVLASNLAARHGVSLAAVAAVIAAHSMNASWSVNVRRAESQLAGKPVGLSAAILMARNAIDADAVGLDPLAMVIGPKINPFARCVAGDLTAVATDRWAQRAAFDSLDDKVNNRFIGRKGMRDNMIHAYTIAAHEAGIEPAVMQAIVWVVIRGKAD